MSIEYSGAEFGDAMHNPAEGREVLAEGPGFFQQAAEKIPVAEIGAGLLAFYGFKKIFEGLRNKDKHGR